MDHQRKKLKNRHVPTAGSSSKSRASSSKSRPPIPLRRRSARLNKLIGTDEQTKTTSAPPLDPEMMKVWFPPPETIKQFDISKIRRLTDPTTGFSARALALHADKQAALSNKIPKLPASTIRQNRQRDAEVFRTWYKYGPNHDDKTCVWSAGGRHSWTEISSGIPWVAVHGADHICVVIRKIYATSKRCSVDTPSNTVQVWNCFMQKVVAEMEADEVHQMIGQILTSPFAVVSVVRDADYEGIRSKAPITASGEEKCIGFLVDKLRSASAISYTETIQTAISAMQYLYSNKLNCSDIGVSVMEKSDGKVVEMFNNEVKDIWPQDLPGKPINILKAIKEHFERKRSNPSSS